MPPGVRTTTLRPKQHSLRIHSCSTSGGPIWHRIWKNLGLHLQMKVQGLIKDSSVSVGPAVIICSSFAFLWLPRVWPIGVSSLPSLTQEAILSPSPLHSFHCLQVYQSFLTLRMNTWTNSSVATTHMWPLSTWNMAGVTEEPHFLNFISFYLHLKTDTRFNSWKTF